MISLWLCMTAVALVVSPAQGQDVVRTLKLYPAPNATLAGVFQVSLVDDQQMPQYDYNASEARDVCKELGVTIASKAQVQEALNRGLETCRFGWVDEQIAVVPRINARQTCGQNGLGVVIWRADVNKKFDAFCFNSSAEDAMPLNNTVEIIVESVTEIVAATVIVMQPEDGAESEAEIAARLMGSEESSSGGKAVLITSLCGVLLVGVIVVVYLKLRRRRSDQRDIETE